MTEPTEDGDNHRIYEIHANSWDDWLVVLVGTATGERPLRGPTRAARHRDGETSAATLHAAELAAEPFVVLDEAASAQFEPADEVLNMAPLRGVAGLPDLELADTAETLDKRVVDVAARLDLDTDELDAAVFDIGEGHTVSVAWLVDAELALDWEDDWVRKETTTLETNAAPLRDPER